MRKIPKIRWYEWIGWLVNMLMMALAALFVVINFKEGETRACWIGLFGSGIPILFWTWVLLYFGKGKGESPSEEAREI